MKLSIFFAKNDKSWRVALVAGMFVVMTAVAQGQRPDYYYTGDAFTECPSECGTFEFCGTDNQCHAYSCETWFVYGPPAFTVVSSSSSIDGDKDPLDQQLTCRPLSVNRPDTDFWGKQPLCEVGLPLAAVLYDTSVVTNVPLNRRYCQGGQPRQLATLPFDRKCTAKRGNESFVCWDVTSQNALLEYETAIQQATTAANLVETKTTDTSTNQDSNTTNTNNATATTDTTTHYARNIVQGYSFYNDTDGSTGDNQPQKVIVSFNPALRYDADADYLRERVAVAMVSERFEIHPDDLTIPYCAPEGCPVGTFCGNDGTCHDIGNCATFYQYGPVNKTGRLSNDDDAPPLNCTLELQTDKSYNACYDFDPETQTRQFHWPLAVAYECHFFNRMYSSSSAACPSNYTEGRELPFSRMCTAEPNPYQDFVCFDTVGVLAEDIVQYEQTVLDNGQCTVDNVLFWGTGSEWDRVANWTTCQGERSSDCFAAAHVYANEIQHEWEGGTISHFFYPYGTSRFIHEDPAPDGNIVDRQWLSYTMASYLSGVLPDDDDAPTGAPDEEEPDSSADSLVSKSLVFVSMVSVLMVMIHTVV